MTTTETVRINADADLWCCEVGRSWKDREMHERLLAMLADSDFVARARQLVEWVDQAESLEFVDSLADHAAELVAAGSFADAHQLLRHLSYMVGQRRELQEQ